VDDGLATVVPSRGTRLSQVHPSLYIQAFYPERKIVVLWQNDQFERDLYKGIQDGLGDLARRIIVSVAFDIADAHIDGHVSILKRSGAEILVFAGVPTTASQAIRLAADFHWHPVLLLNDATASIGTALGPAGAENAVGVISATFLKDRAIRHGRTIRRSRIGCPSWTNIILTETMAAVPPFTATRPPRRLRRYEPARWIDRGLRTVALDDDSIAFLLKEKEKHLRIKVGVPDAADVDLSLVRLPDGALMFPNVPDPGEDFSFTASCNPRNFSKEYARRAKRLGFEDFQFHHLRGTHATPLLDRNVPVHVVAERIGGDPAVLLRNYAKRKRSNTADNSVAAVIGALASGFSKG
jgi:hypothetical protein